MRGRDLFRFLYIIFVLFSLPLYLLPRFIVSGLWIYLDLFPGLTGVGLRYIFAKRLCKKVGENVFFGRGIEIKNWKNFEIGNNVSIHKDCYIDSTGGLKIGNDVSIAHNSSILTFEHTWNDINLPIRCNPTRLSKVEIKDDVWIGCGCRILSGVVVESRSIIAAGAVVKSNVESNSIVGGVPAKLIKRI